MEKEKTADTTQPVGDLAAVISMFEHPQTCFTGETGSVNRPKRAVKKKKKKKNSHEKKKSLDNTLARTSGHCFRTWHKAATQPAPDIKSRLPREQTGNGRTTGRPKKQQQ